MPSPSDLLISSTRVEEGFHDRVTVWNRGGNAGTLTVRKGDGAEVAARLGGRERNLRAEDACAFLVDQAAALSAKVAALEAGDEPAADAATLAFDAIAKACGCPQWDYPGQLVRDVEKVVKQRDDLRHDFANACDVGRRLEVRLNAALARVAELEAAQFAPTESQATGGGDADEVCTICAFPVPEPHTWEACARALKAAFEQNLDSGIEERETLHARVAELEKLLAERDAEVGALRAERDEVRAALEDAHEGMGEMIIYVDGYFRTKHSLDAYVTRANVALAKVSP